MKLFYVPFSILAGLLGARVGRRMFDALWGGISDTPKPAATEEGASLTRVALSAALEGATLAASSAVAHQLSVRLFHHLFGVWPGRSRPQSAAEAS